MDFHGWWVWAASGSMLAIAATCWRQVMSWFQFFRGLVIIRKTIESQFSCQVIIDYLSAHFTMSRFGDRTLDAESTWVTPLERVAIVAYYCVRGNYLFWQGWRPVWVKFSNTDPKNPNQGKSTLELSCLRWTHDLERLFLAACAVRDALLFGDESCTEQRYFISHLNGSAGDDRPTGNGMDGSSPQPLSGDVSGKIPIQYRSHEIGSRQADAEALGAVALSAATLDVAASIRRWHGSRKWYRERKITWRMGVALYGQPGCGKTSFVRAIGKSLNMPIFVLGLPTFRNRELESAFERARSNTPCIVLIEEIDATFDRRRELKDITFDCLLNCIDGVDESDGLLLMVTTNDPSKIDPAIGQVDPDGRSTRPGRLDYLVEFKPPDREGLTKIARRIMRDCPGLWEDTIDAGMGETGAQFQQRCREVALVRFWGVEVSGRVDRSLVEV